jgi:uncharacterized membrane protein YfcA
VPDAPCGDFHMPCGVAIAPGGAVRRRGAAGRGPGPALSGGLGGLGELFAALPLIHDPWFYAVAVPAVLLMGISKSGFGAGFGALAVPLMALTVPVPQAAAIMLPVLAVADGFGMAALMREADRHLLRHLLPAGLVGVGVGWALFGVLSTAAVSGIVGALTLLFLAQRLVFKPRAEAHVPARPIGLALGAASGFTSFVAHAGSPPITIYLLPMRLAPLRYAATLAVFFTVINLSKWLPYGLLGLIDWRNMTTAVVLLPLAPLGVWIGVRLARVIQPTLFYQLVHLGMLLTGAKLLYDGLR